MREGTIHIDAIDFDNGYSLVRVGDTLVVRRRGTDILLINASTGALTLPSAAGTLATLAGTETLTNKTISLTSNTVTFTSAELATACSNETGSGLLVFATSPTFTTPLLGTPTSGVLSNCTSTSMVLTTPVIGAATGTSLSLTGALAGGTTLTPGTGTALADFRDSGVWTNGSVIITRLVLDIDDETVEAVDGDILGDDGAANAHFGQITAAVNGTIIGGTMTCLQAPTTGSADIMLWSADESTLAEGDAIVTLGTNEVTLVDRAGSWAAGDVRVLTGMPVANQYLYLTNGAAANAGVYDAGIFLIELYGT
jgi:hypothetical protein